jgi:hypothetical protein
LVGEGDHLRIEGSAARRGCIVGNDLKLYQFTDGDLRAQGGFDDAYVSGGQINDRGEQDYEGAEGSAHGRHGEFPVGDGVPDDN